MPHQSLPRKLRIEEGQEVLIVNAPKGFEKKLGSLASNADDSPAEGKKYDFVQLFVNNKSEYDKLSRPVLAAVADDAMFWICFPKKSAGKNSDLSRDTLILYPQTVGFKGVSVISIDDIWSAMRFRHSGQVGKVRSRA